MGVNSLPKTVTRQRRDCDLNPGPSAPESNTLTTRLPSHPNSISAETAPPTPLRELTALPNPIAGLRGPISKGKKREKEGRRRMDGRMPHFCRRIKCPEKQ